MNKECEMGEIQQADWNLVGSLSPGKFKIWTIAVNYRLDISKLIENTITATNKKF